MFGFSFEIILYIAIGVIVICGLYSLLRGSQGKMSEGYFLPEDSKEATTIEFAPKVVNSEMTSNGKGPVESLGEAECRRVLQSYYGLQFPKVRPAFLKNEALSSKRPLELDCYNEDLKIACEYDGRAHAEYSRWFHRNEEAFETQRYRDWMKDKLCEENGVHLIRVPHTVKFKDIEMYIMERLPRRN